MRSTSMSARFNLLVVFCEWTGRLHAIGASNRRAMNQLVDAAGSVGANLEEARAQKPQQPSSSPNS